MTAATLQPFQKTQLQPHVGASVDSLCHPWFTTTNLFSRFPIFETSATALCGTTGMLIYSLVVQTWWYTHTHRKYPDMERSHYGCTWWVAKTEPQRTSSLHSSDSPGPGAIHGSSVKSAVSPVAPSMKERHCGAGTWWIRWCPLREIPTKIMILGYYLLLSIYLGLL